MCVLEFRNASIVGQEVGVMKRKVPKKSGMLLSLWPVLIRRGGVGWGVAVYDPLKASTVMLTLFVLDFSPVLLTVI